MSIRNIVFAGLLMLGSQAGVASDTTQGVQHEFDVLAMQVIESLINAELPLAQSQAATLVKRYPNSSLGQMLFAETQSIGGFQNGLLNEPEQLGKPLLDLLLEARARLNAPTLATNDVPNNIVQTAGTTNHIILVDLAASVLWLIDTQGTIPTVTSQHYIASGAGGYNKFSEGDLKTPLGIYSINGIRSDASLPELYGVGAMVLNYPNAFDRANGRTGSGIWLHGVPRDEWNRSPFSSEGCVTMANDLFIALASSIDPTSTKVVFDSNISWHKPAGALKDRADMMALFERFQRAWQQRHVKSLQSLYSDSMQTDVEWQPISSLKKVSQSEASKEFIFNSEQIQALSSLEHDAINILRHRSLSSEFEEQEVTVMSFNLGPQGLQVALYWAQDAKGAWRIVHQTTTTSSI